MRINVEYCYEEAKKAIQAGDSAEALRLLDLLHNELRRVQGVVDAFVREQSGSPNE